MQKTTIYNERDNYMQWNNYAIHENQRRVSKADKSKTTAIIDNDNRSFFYLLNDTQPSDARLALHHTPSLGMFNIPRRKQEKGSLW
jgi:hypothetical protein